MSALAKVKEAEAALSAARNELKASRSRQKIVCCCGKQHAIRELDLIIRHFYVSPHGCTGGDYWLPGEWNFICPNGVLNRLLFNDYDVEWHDRKTVGVAAEPTFKQLYGECFKSVAHDYSEGLLGPNNINRYVDKNRKKFGLPERGAS